MFLGCNRIAVVNTNFDSYIYIHLLKGMKGVWAVFVLFFYRFSSSFIL